MRPLALLLCCLALPVLADDNDHDRARRALQAGEILPLSEILERAETARPGRVIEVELDRDDGRWIYELEMVTDTGRLYEMELDAATGAILKIEAEEDDD
ncbi:PepSY domain-containing protein [Oceanicola sp. 22II-s10i]|uniref:PepSY domain-containing protein n=1 Tax=Oceanicola sp. 22II-s10i TaxID=1317116 RepID=UPI000B523C35|nr:PepSY domain-containing protein [Oceanicola sp. 22II-s10i]